ncbi:glycosyltransferase family 10 [Planktomarina temperata]|nr:glycosyltransferase family 10 [Planktomarina temperata]
MIGEPKMLAIHTDYDHRVKFDALFEIDPIDNEYIFLKEFLTSLGWKVHTLDVYKAQGVEPDICLFLDMPKSSLTKYITEKTIPVLYLRENRNIIKRNYDLNRHSQFSRIMTWDKSLTEKSDKYVYTTPTTITDQEKPERVPFNKKAQLVMIQTNLFNNFPGECYSLRREIVAHYTNNGSDNFHVYGSGWDKYHLSLLGKSFKIPYLVKQVQPHQGRADNKRSTLSKYKFAICFENMDLVPGYVTEKIFDCFYARCIPIYYGAENIHEFVPPETFIDYRKFGSIGSLDRYLQRFDEQDYTNSIMAAEKFIASAPHENFMVHRFCSRIHHMLSELK